MRVALLRIGSGRVILTSPMLTCKTCLMMDTCAGEGIRPRGSDQTAQRDTTVATQSVTVLDDPAHGNVDEEHFESHKFQVRCNEADVGFMILSAGKTSQQSDWFESDGGYEVMLPGPSEQTRTCAKDSNVAKLEENRMSVLVARIGSGKHGWSTVEHEVPSGNVSC